MDDTPDITIVDAATGETHSLYSSKKPTAEDVLKSFKGEFLKGEKKATILHSETLTAGTYTLERPQHFADQDNKHQSLSYTKTRNWEKVDSAVVAYKDQQIPPSALTQDFYSPHDLFGTTPFHSYWTTNLRADRFHADGKILYRPSITEEIVSDIDKCFRATGIQGLMIKGPQGIGKSHSIVNLYRRLVTSTENRFLVTVIPYCESWKDVVDFMNAICQSLGLKLKDIGFESDEILTIEHARILVRVVQQSVQAHELRWVFIFDQINSLFAKKPDAKKFEELPEPYILVKQVMLPRNTVSVIAASANNEIAYKDRHPAFLEYHHPISLAEGELSAFVDYLNSSPDVYKADGKKKEACDNEDEMEESDGDDEEKEGTMPLEDLQRIAGGVPLYTFIYLKDPMNFENAINPEVESSLNQLRDSLVKDDPPRWEKVKESILSALLGIPTTATLYDRKYMTVESIGYGLFKYKTLFPAIEGAYRTCLLWDDLMKFVKESEAWLLTVCKDANTTNNTRDRIFESIAIRRMQSDAGGVAVKLENDAKEFLIPKQSVQTVSGSAFPEVPTGTKALILPQNPNFPAIDWIWANGSCIYGVQCHVSQHEDVFDKFVLNARKSKRFDNFEEVVLLYFSPEPATTNLVHNCVDPALQEVPLGRKLRGSAAQPKTASIKRSAISISSVSSMAGLQWPKGCSVPKKLRTINTP